MDRIYKQDRKEGKNIKKSWIPVSTIFYSQNTKILAISLIISKNPLHPVNPV